LVTYGFCRMSEKITGQVASLHLHPPKPGEALRAVEKIEVVVEKGIAGNGRYFGRVRRTTGLPSRRQVSLMEREQIAAHAVTLGLPSLLPGAVRANVETSGLELMTLIGREVQVGDARLFFYEARTPCEKMDCLCFGLRALMENGRQGVLAQVTHSGTIRVGDAIVVLDTKESAR